MDIGWINMSNAWYVNSLELKLAMLVHGLGYSWLNEEYIASKPSNLVKLDLDIGSIRQHKLFLAYRSDTLGENARLLIKLLKKHVKKHVSFNFKQTE